eukprot:tig00020723_g13437.t1
MTELYFERQSRLHCGLHALNMLFGRAEFDDAELRGYAKSIPGAASYFSNMRILGNYDVNVLMMALTSRGCEAEWVSAGNLERSAAPAALEAGGVVGLLVCRRSDRLGRLVGAMHWIAVRRVGPTWVLLDSNAQGPTPLASAGDVMTLLRECLAYSRAGALLVRGPAQQ